MDATTMQVDSGVRTLVALKMNATVAAFADHLGGSIA